uniref:hypothetical protein n=1 Tax=Agathobacter sp. TaxID=2021311 RepID=UPI004056C6A5
MDEKEKTVEDNQKKDSNIRLKLIISVMIFLAIFIAELYALINAGSPLLITAYAVMEFIAVYFVADSILEIREQNHLKLEQQYETILSSEKASHIMLKNSFDEMYERLMVIEKIIKISGEEIINAQKGTSKVVINRNKENAEAIVNLNVELVEQLKKNRVTQEEISASIDIMQDKTVSEMNREIDLKLQQLTIQMKDMELRLNQAMMQNFRTVTVSSPIPMMEAAQQTNGTVPETSIESAEDAEEEFEDVFLEESILEETQPSVEVAPEIQIEEPMEQIIENIEMPQMMVEEPATDESIPEDITSTDISADGEEPEELVEETPIIPNLSNTNKMMTPEEIESLLENAEKGILEEPIQEEIKEEIPQELEEEPIAEPIVEEKPPMPDLSDPNKVMSADDIAALIANMGNDPMQEEGKEEIPEELEEEPIAEPIVEEKPPMPDLSNPNKVMSPDEIAALIANL